MYGLNPIHKETTRYLSTFKSYQVSEDFEVFLNFYFSHPNLIFNGLRIEADLLHRNTCKILLENDQYKNLENKLIYFADANYSGSAYAFWLRDESIPLTDNPIIFIGDEGCISVVANNFLDLLLLLSTNIDPCFHYNEEFKYGIEFLHSGIDINLNGVYNTWIEQELNLVPIDNIEVLLDDIIKPALDKHQTELNKIFPAHF